MSENIIGHGWAFPPKIDAQGGLALTNMRSEIQQAIEIILSTSPGQRVMRPTFGCRLHELVFSPNNSHTAAQARRYGLKLPYLRDEDATIARLFGAETAPEAFLFDGSSRLVYRGGASGLRSAMESLLANTPVPSPTTEPAGCPIVFPQ